MKIQVRFEIERIFNFFSMSVVALTFAKFELSAWNYKQI